MNNAEKKAISLLKEEKVTEPPINIANIAKGLGLQLSYEPFDGIDDISGMLYCDNENNILGINSAHSHTRQRFSIAHEVGHFLLHKKKLFVDKKMRIAFRDSKSSMAIDKQEIDANAFAAEILMPREFIENELKKEMADIKDNIEIENIISALAKTFQVSTQAMRYRLINLGIIDAE